MNCLFIGRFQPFHKGHLQIIQSACSKYGEVIIGLGSSQYGYTLENPFTSDERKLMIEESLKGTDVKNYRVTLIPDIHDYPKWVDYVISIISDFDVVISNSTLTKRLFSEKGYGVKKTPLYDRGKCSGREIRRRIINDEPWENLVPGPVYDVIKNIDGVNRLKKLSKN